MSHSPPASPLRLALAGMVVMAAVMGIGRFVYTPVLPGMMEELGLSAADAGLIASANYLGYLLGAIAAAGAWAHGLERRILLAGLVANAALAAAMGLVDTTIAFLLLRFLAGAASAFAMIFTTSTVFSHLAAAGRDGLQAVHFAGVGLGIAASSAMMAGLISVDAGWQAGWFGAAALSMVAVVAAFLAIDRGPASLNGAGREPPLPRSRPLLLITIAYGLFGVGYIVTATFLIAIVRAGGTDRLFETAVWFATGLAALPSVFVWNYIARRIGLFAAYVLGCVVQAVGVAASVGLGGHAGPLLGGVLLGGTLVALTALGFQAGRELAPASPRRVMAVMTAAFGVGQILGPIAAGFIAEWTGDFVLASGLAALALLVAAVVAFVARAEKRRKAGGR